MTSLDLFPPATPRQMTHPPAWGTGKMKGEKTNLWTAGRPTWQYSGEPNDQLYELTDLKLSNLRLNDQLIPNPQHCDISKAQIDLPFPSEHPYASHIPRTAMFPNYDSPEDPKTGSDARKQMPKNAHIPANAYDIIVLKKTKGSGLRHELQALPAESLKTPLHWLDHDFNQLMKYPGADKQTYYPTPVTLLKPNASTSERSSSKCVRGDMVVSAHNADIAKNLERDQWTTTYDRTHTGLGPANPYQLDNYYDKMGKDNDDDALRPRTTRTFDPARPVEGRIARTLTRPANQQTHAFPEHQKDSTYIRRMTEHEREEDRLWNGNEYLSLPDTQCGAPQNESQQHPDVCLDNLDQYRLQQHADDQTDTQGRPLTTQSGPVDQQHDAFQQIEAANRWKVLELQQPHHNIQARQHKMDLVSTKEQPAVFYQHEGKFQSERAGLYNTTYDPSKLKGTMNAEAESGARIMDISDCHVGALDLPTTLNQDMAEAIRYNRTMGNPGSVAQLNDQPNQYETFEPFNKAKELQTGVLQPSVRTSDVRTHEGGLVLKESTYGDGYNTKKFLQENQLPPHVRNEPLQVMSNVNQNLVPIRVTCTPNFTAGRPLKVPDDILTGDPLPGGDWLSKSFDFGGMRPHSTPNVSPAFPRYSYSTGNLTARNATPGQTLDLPVDIERSRVASRYGVEDQLLSKSSNFFPNTQNSWSAKSAYQSQYPGGATPRKPPLTDLSFKDDERFSWKPSSGTPRPQTSLLDIQDSFKISEIRKKFHQQFPETNVDLRENIILGKKHTFGGINAQVFRGTPVVD